ncbi:sialate O-acetylesterase [Limibacter armeniacum]|uniref:sialate O-acetylesterase n=1 Tax=Limibacter armeniacum TaxID=466084 RepID=UPI002FE5116F
MRNLKSLGILFMFLIPALAIGQKKAEKDTVKVFLLAGQSNMDGYGYNKDLPSNLKSKFKNVWIFHGNSAADDQVEGGSVGQWEQLQPGHGVGFTATEKKNNHADRFGLEMTFAKKLQELYPNEKIALIKYSRGGTSIDSMAARYAGCWTPDFDGKTGINQYDHALATIRNAYSVKDIDGDGKEDILKPAGILWMQGESDGDYNEEVAYRYHDNLKQLMDLLRASLLTDDLPVVIGKITDSFNDKEDGAVWNYGDIVRYAQEKFVRTDSKAAIVRTTKFYEYSDPWHYTSAGYIDMGEQFAIKMYELMEGKPETPAKEVE